MVEDQELKSLREHKKADLLSEMGSFRRWWLLHVACLYRRGVLTEVENDLLIVRQFAARVESAKRSPDQNETLAEILAHLDVAAVETDVARAWRQINAADALLPLVVPTGDLIACEGRLQTWDKSLDQKLAERLNPAQKCLLTARESGSDDDKRHALQRMQNARSQVWNELNNRIALKRALWATLGRWVFFATCVAVGAAEVLRSLKRGEPMVAGWPFGAAALLGFFGGALSALVRARTVVIEIPSYRSVKLHTLLRMLMGAAGAFVVYVIAVAMPLGELSASIQSNVYMFITVSIAAGFSERLFVQALEEVAKNLKSVS